ncbi:hypothetical protein FALCPG4_000019 [Fusarium falciforme]
MQKLLPEDIDVNEHFNPSYAPYEQRLCLCPDGDYFKALSQPHCSIATEHIWRVTESGILLKSGRFLEADMIITATGQNILFLGGIPAYVDGERINDSLSSRYLWNGILLEGVPNLSITVTYTEATAPSGTWIRVRQLLKVVKRETISRKTAAKVLSTYIVSAQKKMPIVADKAPWWAPRNYFQDWKILKFRNVNKV